MYLMYYLNETGDRVYTLKVGEPIPFHCTRKLICVPYYSKSTSVESRRFRPILVMLFNKKMLNNFLYDYCFSARFSPEDKYSQQRYTIKKRFNLLPTQKASPVY